MNNLSEINTMRQTETLDPIMLVDEYGDLIYSFCRSLTYSKEDAEDLFQETFLKVLVQPEKISASTDPQNFLFSTALFLWKSWKRKYARRNRIAPSELFNEYVYCNTDIENEFLIQEENRIIRELVDKLPDKFRIPVILYYTFEWDIMQIAEVMNIPQGTIKSRLYKARKIIKKGLVGNER